MWKGILELVEGRTKMPLAWAVLGLGFLGLWTSLRVEERHGVARLSASLLL